MTYPARFLRFAATFLVCLLSLAPKVLVAQDSPTATQTAAATAAEDTNRDAPAALKDVVIDPLAADDEIADRLTKILTATTWFENPQVKVDEGVVFLKGTAGQADYRTLAGDLPRNTQDVVAVVNRIQVTERSIWDLSPAWIELRKLERETIQMFPLLALAVLLLVGTWFAASLSTRVSRVLLGRRIQNLLLISVIARAIAIPVFLLGLYLALRVSGLTQMAATVLGGTGLIGLVLGIAFRDIAENFLASVLISVQRPFALGDLIEVEGNQGIVQSVTARGTLLMTMDGNHVQIPDSIIYKSIIHNTTANPNIRCNFVVGIDYADSIATAQKIVIDVLRKHEAVLETPEPMVLVDELGPSTVNLRIYFWINGHTHSQVKVRSSVIRLTKLAIEEAGLTMPDASREVIFPKGVPVHIIEATKMGDMLTMPSTVSSSKPPRQPTELADRSESSSAENGLKSEQGALEEQARNARSPESGANLLEK